MMSTQLNLDILGMTETFLWKAEEPQVGGIETTEACRRPIKWRCGAISS